MHTHVDGTKERAPSRLLQRAESGHSRAPFSLHEPKALVAVHQGEAEAQSQRNRGVSGRAVPDAGGSVCELGNDRPRSER